MTSSSGNRSAVPLALLIGTMTAFAPGQDPASAQSPPNFNYVELEVSDSAAVLADVLHTKIKDRLINTSEGPPVVRLWRVTPDTWRNIAPAAREAYFDQFDVRYVLSVTLSSAGPPGRVTVSASLEDRSRVGDGRISFRLEPTIVRNGLDDFHRFATKLAGDVRAAVTGKPRKEVIFTYCFNMPADYISEDARSRLPNKVGRYLEDELNRLGQGDRYEVRWLDEDAVSRECTRPALSMLGYFAYVFAGHAHPSDEDDRFSVVVEVLRGGQSPLDLTMDDVERAQASRLPRLLAAEILKRWETITREDP